MSYPDKVVRVIAENRGAEVNIIELDDTGASDHEKLGYALVDLGIIIFLSIWRIILIMKLLGETMI